MLLNGLDRPERIDATSAGECFPRPHDRRTGTKRAGRAKDRETVERTTGVSQLLEGVLDPFDVWRDGTSHRFWSQEGHLCPVVASNVGDRLVVGRHDASADDAVGGDA